MEHSSMELKEHTQFGSDDYQTSWLLHNGIIDQADSIYEQDARGIQSCLDLIGELIDSGKISLDRLRLRIWASPGGGATAALAAYDVLRLFSKRYEIPIQSEIYGGAASAACMILSQAGDTRLASPSSTFLLHEVRQFAGYDSETYSDIADKKAGMDMCTQIVYNILAEKCGKTYDEVFDFIDRRENWLSFEDALDWGLIDGEL